MYNRLRLAGKTAHAAYLKGFCSAAGGDLLISVMQQALPKGGGASADAARGADPASARSGRARARGAGREPGCAPAGGADADCRALFKALHRIECAFNAYNALRACDAGALSPQTEQRLQALLVDRAMPLLLRCMQTWKAGARRSSHTARGACLAASLPALWRSRAGFLSRPDAALLGRWLPGSCMPHGSTCRSCSQLLLVVVPTLVQPAACTAPGYALASSVAKERVVTLVDQARCCPGAAAPCGNLLTRPAGGRLAAVHGRRRMLLRQRAEQAAELRGAVHARAAAGPHPHHALPLHHAAVGNAAHC